MAKELLVASADVFFKDDLDLGKCNILKQDIKITDPQPFKERYRRIPLHLYEEVKAHLQEMVEVGTIRRSFSPWVSAVVLVRKKDGCLRFCIDLCKLNNRNCQGWVFSTPYRGYPWTVYMMQSGFPTLDLKSGYWQVELEEDAKPLTTFTMGPLGFWGMLTYALWTQQCSSKPFRG